MIPLVVLANERPQNHADRPAGRPHVCFSCHRFYDGLCLANKGPQAFEDPAAKKKRKAIGGRDARAFPPECRLSTDIQLDEFRKDPDLQALPVDERVYLEYAVDPVDWADFELGWSARWYQEELLRCTSKKKVVRAGRRLGKTAALAVDALHKTCTQENFKVLIVAPYQAQIDLIFDEIDKLLAGSLTIKGTVEGRVRHPDQKIKFFNGSVITGQTAGVKSGNDAGKIRGQDANAIYLDETDMLSAGDLKSILAIISGHQDVFLWASGTPSGKHEHFYQWATNKDLEFKEFHYKSSMGPEWTPATERWLRATYSTVAFAQEFDAEFGEEEAGVFPKKLVADAVLDYDLDRTIPVQGRLYGMGVDWNDTVHGVHITIGSWRPEDGKFWLEKKIIISKVDFTQTAAVEEIIRLNALWNPSYIYVDKGFGQTQIEHLRAYGMRNPASGIVRKLKGIGMGEKVPMLDPFLGRVLKEVKPFIVNLAVRRIEEGEAVLPRSEYRGEGTEGLVDQMIAFRIKRFSPEGRPVYDSTPDHTLTAWMLMIYGFWMEHSEIGQRRGSNKVGHVHGATGPGKLDPEQVGGTIVFEIPRHEVAAREAAKRTRAGGASGVRTLDLTFKQRNMSDIQAAADQKKRTTTRIGHAGRAGLYNYLSKAPPKRKTF